MDELKKKCTTVSNVERMNTSDYHRTISATQVAAVMGFDMYDSDRKIYRCKRKSDTSTSKIPKPPAPACAFGIKYEPLAVKLFGERHKIVSGFVPPYLKTDKSPFIGGKADYLFQFPDQDGDDFVLLEIKCLYSRDITRKIPIAYWLQIQTMLYVYRQRGLNVSKAFYCENKFADSCAESSLTDYWEQEIVYDEEYYQSIVLPVIDVFYRNLMYKKGTNIKRMRQCFRGKLNTHRWIDQINVNLLYSNYLISGDETSRPDNAISLNNYLNGDTLVDWIQRYETPQQQQQQSNQLQRSYQPPHDLKQITTENAIMIDINRLLYPKNADTLLILPETRCWQLSRIFHTIRALKTKADIIVGAQLYYPEYGMYSNYDVLVKTRSIVTSLDIDRNYPDGYHIIKLVQTVTSGCTQSQYKMRLYCDMMVYLGYFSRLSRSVIIMAENGQNEVIKFTPQYEKRCRKNIQNGISWLQNLRKYGSCWSIDPPDRPELYPNAKCATTGVLTPVKKKKMDLIHKNEELTQIWYLSVDHRNRLVDSGIKTMSDLYSHIDDASVKSILASKYENTRNILQANMTKQLVNVSALHKSLSNKIGSHSCKVFLDFEFTHMPLLRVYLIGMIVETETKVENYQIAADHFDDPSEVALFKKMESILAQYDSILCLHWGAVESSIVKSKMSEEFSLKLQMLDLCQLFIDNRVGIPNCYSYGLKAVGSALSKLDINIRNGWTGDDNGEHWDRVIQNFIKTNDPNQPLEQCSSFDELKKYNMVDCEVMFDIYHWALLQ